MNSKVIEVENIKKSFGRKKNIKAVDGVSFSVYKNEIFSLLGPNGSGKTTTIKMLLGLIIPDEGHINILENKIPKERKKIMDKVGVILEGARNLYWDMSVEENTFYFGNLKGRGIKEIREVMELWANRLGLQNYLHLPVGKLSRGMQQKAAIICSMSIKPEILILDEPLLGLDVMTRFEMEEIIDDIRKDTTLILSSHDLKFIEKVTDRVAIFKEGKIISLGNISDLKLDLSVYKYNITLKKSQNSSHYKKELENINGLVIKEIYSDDVKDLVEITLTKEELIYDVMEVFKECQVIPIEINSLDNDFQEIFLRILERKDKDYETYNEC